MTQTTNNAVLRGVVGIVLLLSPLFTTSCSPAPSHYVVKGEYILKADGPFCPWRAGVRDCKVVYPAGEYVEVEGEKEPLKLLRTAEAQENLNRLLTSSIIPYDEEGDKCKELTPEGFSCSPNYIVSTLAAPNDPLVGQQWGLEAIQAYKGWNVTTGSPEVPVAIIDTGIDRSHPDLKGLVWREFNAITGEEGEGRAFDNNGHGTHVAGTVCAHGNNGEGVSGVAWRCKLIAVKFLNANGSGTLFDALRGLSWLNTLQTREGLSNIILNNSWGGGGYSEPLLNSIIQHREAGNLFVRAAGNSGVNNDKDPNTNSYNSENVITVGAITPDKALANFSNFGRRSVHIAAPGLGIVSTKSNGGYVALSGTSMATPHVSGTLALLRSKYPLATWSELKAMLLSGARRCKRLAKKIAAGRILNVNGSLLGKKHLRCKERV